jgi:outer membrane murein-binding lipoprotein Lpp
MKYLLQRTLPLSLLTSLLLAGCATIASYDQISYEKATAAKAEALALMDKATASYSSKREEIEQVSLTIDKAYEYDRGRNLNAETVRQWEILRAPSGNLFGAFLRRWREKGALRPDAIAIKKPDIADAFDQIIGLEIGKRRTKTN